GAVRERRSVGRHRWRSRRRNSRSPIAVARRRVSLDARRIDASPRHAERPVHGQRVRRRGRIDGIDRRRRRRRPAARLAIALLRREGRRPIAGRRPEDDRAVHLRQRAERRRLRRPRRRATLDGVGCRPADRFCGSRRVVRGAARPVKILVIHQYYLAPGEPGGSRFNEFARLWTEAGHQVTVIAGSVSYATGKRARSVAAGFTVRGLEDGIDVWRCHVPQTYNRSYAGRMWAFFGFTVPACVAALRTARPDIVIATSPPLTAVIPGFVAARCRWRPAPWVFEMRDLWPESAITTDVIGRTSLLARILFALERWGCRRAAMVNVLTPAFADDLKARGLVTAEKLCFVPNGADGDAFQ